MSDKRTEAERLEDLRLYGTCETCGEPRTVTRCDDGVTLLALSCTGCTTDKPDDQQ